MKDRPLTYEVTLINSITQHGTKLNLAKFSLENFSAETDRYIQIDHAIRQRFPKTKDYRLHLMKPQEVDQLHSLADDGLAMPHKIAGGLVMQLMELNLNS